MVAAPSIAITRLKLFERIIMKSLFLPALLTMALLAALPASAQNAASNQTTAADALPKVSGEIRKVDPDTGKITIRHAEIPNLEMPNMTMLFRVAEPAMLTQFKAGDKVMFSAQKIDGALVVTRMEAAP